MRGRLQGLMNRVYVQTGLQALKWGLIFLGVALLGVGISVKFVLPKAKKQYQQQQGVEVVRDADGQPKTLYKDKALPKNYQEELRTGAPTLIYENQARAYEEDSDHEDHSPDQDKVARSERRSVARVAAKFLRNWETFYVGESDRQYERRLASTSDPGQLEALRDRVDNLQNSSIGRRGISGSRLVDPSQPGRTLRILRYDGNTAYVSMFSEIEYTGPSLSFSGRKVRRSYALVMTRFRDGWKVTRAAAQTQGGIIE